MWVSISQSKRDHSYRIRSSSDWQCLIDHDDAAGWFPRGIFEFQHFNSSSQARLSQVS
jgi:hypothetical protein